MKRISLFLATIALILSSCYETKSPETDIAPVNSNTELTVEATELLVLEGYDLPELGYSYDALEPYIDAQTVALHWEKHTKGYFNKMIKALDGSDWQGLDFQALFAIADQLPPAVLNNAGQVYNHMLYFENIGPEQGEMSPELSSAIDEAFGSFETFREEFTKAAKSLFGSGWVYLSKDAGGKLFISSTGNQVNPLMSIADKLGTPILTIDVWEHAYYLNYQNRRPEYIDGFWNLINWDVVSERFAS